jgi:DNA-binding transcriptional LysR family regulator
MSQPSLSKTIQDIERRVGTLLFERAHGGVIPTDAGKIFLEQAREMVARSADLSREMDLLRGLEKGELRIGAGTYPAVMIVDQAIAQLVRDHPKVRLHIKMDNWGNLISLLKKREIDIAVIVTDVIVDEPELHITRMNRHQGYFVVRRGHPLVKAKKVLALESLLHFPTVMISRLPSALLKSFLIGANALNPAPSPTMKSFPTIACDSVAMMKTIIAGSDAVGLLPLTPIMPEVRSRRLHVLPFVAPAFKPEIAAVRIANRSLSPLGETFARLLQEVDARVFDSEQRAAARLFASHRPTRARATAATRVL